jgi:hypothetical protein
MFVEQTKITQPAKGLRRRIFIQHEGHFALIVWYPDESMSEIAGFQMGFKSNPFDTDKEFFFTVWPADQEKKVVSSQTGTPTEGAAPAIKTLADATSGPPADFAAKYRSIASSLPPAVRDYVDGKLSNII